VTDVRGVAPEGPDLKRRAAIDYAEEFRYYIWKITTGIDEF
jgi:hypothetical protein